MKVETTDKKEAAPNDGKARVSRHTGESKTRIQQANEQKIIDAAIKVFSRHGFRGATLDQIADQAALSKPNLLYYFKSKKDLYADALNHVLEVWLSPLEGLDPDGDPEKELGDYIEKKMEMSRDYPDASRMWAMEIIEGAMVVMPVLTERLAETTKNKKNVLSQWAKQGKIEKVDGLHLLFMIWAVTQHYADFEAQVKSQTGKTLNDPRFFEGAKKSIKQIIFRGILK